ncbi:MAG: tRNA (adenosine(37)-N6)-threonylcarbamoyltransferase complex transferase subunit TsaD [Acidobacteriota bacterium]|nr:tRNA (adenosine(37)-N6)-threonylcarbamoyltransferase complex transferase subunit TsaD [Acidobacteriota bacterium]
MRYLLGIESSCDDTSIAVVAEDRSILANVVSSQVQEHAPYLGVVPELAGRAHLKNIPAVYRKAMDDAGLSLENMTAIAVTAGPGLAGSLMVGVNFAKGLAMGAGLPLIGVNHIGGHVAALFLEYGEIPLPALALIVSGGHTHLFRVRENRELVLLTKSRDDAAGEAYDKLSKMLGLGFPGGPLIDRLARRGNPKRYAFSKPKFSDGSLDFSFSGMKTAASRHIERDPEAFRDPDGEAVRDLAASFQAAVCRHLLDRVSLGLDQDAAQALLLGGGVACNSHLRTEFEALAQSRGLPAFISSPKLSTDNAAMIAAEGWRLFHLGRRDELDLVTDVSAKPYAAVDLLRKT